MTRTHPQILESLVVGSHRLTRAAAQLSENALTISASTTLSVLSSEGPKRIGDLARIVRISQPGMTKVVQNLAADEWVSRVADVDDSRAWLIAITDSGRAALMAWRHELAASLGTILDDLDDTEWRTLDRAAEILSRHVDSKEAVA